MYSGPDARESQAIFNKLTGALAGLLLVIYGSLSLWLSSASTSASSLRPKLCEYWLCSEPVPDSPLSFDPPNQSLAQAEANLTLNPTSAYRWEDLGEAEINADQVEQGKFCVRQALAAAPGSPAILFRAANFYLRLQDYPETLRHLTAVLRNPDLLDYYDRVFLLYSQMDLPMHDLLNQGLPRAPKPANAFLQFWIRQNKLDEARETWTWMNAQSLAGGAGTGSYVALLTKDGQWPEALQVWQAFTHRLEPNYTKANWVFNGSFEVKPVDCPFDWHLQPAEKVAVTRDFENFYKGSSALRMSFSGAQRSEVPLAYESVALHPGEWQLDAFMKTSKLASDKGVVIRVVDTSDAANLDVATTTFEGTQEWTRINKTFAVLAETSRARLEILRPQSRNLDDRITGTVWIDDVTLSPAPKAGLLKSTGLTEPGEPCESHGNCWNGQARLQTAAKENREE